MWDMGCGYGMWDMDIRCGYVWDVGCGMWDMDMDMEYTSVD